MHERSPSLANGKQLHRALQDALDLSRPIGRHYRLHPWGDDAGYLCALTTQCRQCLSCLPQCRHVRPMMLEHASRAAHVLSSNHQRDGHERELSLRSWAGGLPPGETTDMWFERSASASAGLTIFALLAQQLEHPSRPGETAIVERLYCCLISTIATMLDSYADMDEDAVNEDHIYIAYYETMEQAVERIGEMIREALLGTHMLRDRHRHAVVIASMVAMYLTKDSSRSPRSLRRTRHLTRSGGTLTCLLIPAVRLWRVLYALRSS